MGGDQNTAVTLPIAAPTTYSSSTLHVNEVAHAQQVTSTPKIILTEPSTPPEKKSQGSSATTPKQGLCWVAEPVWVHRRKVQHEREQSQSTPGKSSRFRKARHHFTSKSRYSRKSPIVPQPALQPLVPGNCSWTGTVDGIGCKASTDLWWAQVSNSLASLSARSYHLHIASGYLTCVSEELLLLYEAQRLNFDGKNVYDEVLRGLRERRLDWEFLRGSEGIAELRISWQMSTKREELEMFGTLLGKRIHKLERELQGYAETDLEGEEGTAENEPVIYGDSTKEDYVNTDSSSDKPLPSENEVVPVENNTEPVASMSDNNSSATSTSPIFTTMDSKTLVIGQANWADDVIEASGMESLAPDLCHVDSKTVTEEVLFNGNSTPCIPPVEQLISEDLTLSPSQKSEAVTNLSDSPPVKASSQTWAEVVADSVKNPKRLDGWPAISEKSWAWERNWR